jgi:hypothetical protein
MCVCVCERARIVHALRKYIGTAIKCIYNVLCICSCDVFVQFCISTPMKACIKVCMQATSKAEHADFGARPSTFRRRHIFGISICRTISVSVYRHPCICRTISVYRTGQPGESRKKSDNVYREWTSWVCCRGKQTLLWVTGDHSENSSMLPSRRHACPQTQCER